MVARADVMSVVLCDLAGEGAWLDGVLAGLDDSGWRRTTPAAGWTIAHQVAHLAWTDEQALCAASDRWLDIAQAFAGPPSAGREPKGLA